MKPLTVLSPKRMRVLVIVFGVLLILAVAGICLLLSANSSAHQQAEDAAAQWEALQAIYQQATEDLAAVDAALAEANQTREADIAAVQKEAAKKLAALQASYDAYKLSAESTLSAAYETIALYENQLTPAANP